MTRGRTSRRSWCIRWTASATRRRRPSWLAATAATKVETVRAGLVRLVSFDTATCTLVEHKMSWVSDEEEIADIAVVGSEVIVVHVSGLLVIYNPFAEAVVRFAWQLKLPPGGGLCQLSLHYDGQFLLLSCGEQLSCVPLWPEDRSQSFGALCLTEQLHGGVRSLASLSGTTLFFAVGTERRVVRFGVAPAVPPGLERLRVVENKRSLTQVEECERQKKQEDMQRYVQRKGLMLNLSDVVYTESSKPMGLDFLMDGSLEDELRKSQDKPQVLVTGATPGSALSPKSSGSVHRKSVHGLFSPFKKERRASRSGSESGSDVSPSTAHLSTGGSGRKKEKEAPSMLYKRSNSRPDMFIPK